MEFEIDELVFDAQTSESDGVMGANRAPGWHTDQPGSHQTGVWIPEEGGALTARRIEPVS